MKDPVCDSCGTAEMIEISNGNWVHACECRNKKLELENTKNKEEFRRILIAMGATVSGGSDARGK